MQIGIAFTLKPETPLPSDAPDDLHEEFDSPSTVKAIAEVLRSLGHEVRELGDGKTFVEAVLAAPPDLVFNFAEGTGVSRSRESRVPAVCEMLGIPYSGSDPLALGIALDKEMTRRIVASAGVNLPSGFTFTLPAGDYDGEYAEFPAMLEESGLVLPVLAKPVCEGSSKGIRNRCLIRTVEEFGPTIVQLARDYQQPVLIEEFIAGEEVTTGILGNDPPQVLGTMRVVPKQANEHFVYSLEVKREWEQHVDYEAPAKLPIAVTRALEAEALTVYEALGCRDLARLDFRIRDGVPFFIEINPLPGLNPDSGDLVFLAYRLGLTFPDLIGRVLEAALKRNKLT